MCPSLLLTQTLWARMTRSLAWGPEREISAPASLLPPHPLSHCDPGRGRPWEFFLTSPKGPSK